MDNNKSFSERNDSLILNLEKSIDSASGLKLKEASSFQIETAMHTMQVYTDWKLND